MTRSSVPALLLLAALFLPWLPLHAQPRLSGYYENTFQADYQDEAKETLLDASKLRIDIAAGGGEQELAFRGNVNVIQYHGPVTRDVTPYLPDDIVRLMRFVGAPTTVTYDASRIYLDNAWLTWEHAGFRFRAGKQQLMWGPGYSFNPTDLFHRKDIVDPTYEKEGVTAFRLDYRWGIGGNASLIAAPDDRLETTGFAALLGTHIAPIGYDISLTAHHVTDSTRVRLPSLRPVLQTRDAAGLMLTGSLLGTGVWFEGNYNWMEREDDFIRAVAGIDYTLENGLYLMAEGFYNGRGEEEPPYTINAWLDNLLYGEPVGRGWLMLGTRYDLTMLSQVALYGFVTPDGSSLINPRLMVSIAQNADLVLFGAITTGNPEGAFPAGLYNFVARATVYF